MKISCKCGGLFHEYCMLAVQTQCGSQDRVEVADIPESCIAFHVSWWTSMQTMVFVSSLERRCRRIDTRCPVASSASLQMSSMVIEDVKWEGCLPLYRRVRE